MEKVEKAVPRSEEEAKKAKAGGKGGGKSVRKDSLKGGGKGKDGGGDDKGKGKGKGKGKSFGPVGTRKERKKAAIARAKGLPPPKIKGAPELEKKKLKKKEIRNDLNPNKKKKAKQEKIRPGRAKRLGLLDKKPVKGETEIKRKKKEDKTHE